MTELVQVVVRCKCEPLKQRHKDGRTHRFTVDVRIPREEGGDESGLYIQKVTFQLHESFGEPMRVVTSPPFTLTEKAYANHEVIIRLQPHVGEEVTIKRWVELNLPRSKHVQKMKLTPKRSSPGASTSKRRRDDERPPKKMARTDPPPPAGSVRKAPSPTAEAAPAALPPSFFPAAGDLPRVRKADEPLSHAEMTELAASLEAHFSDNARALLVRRFLRDEAARAGARIVSAEDPATRELSFDLYSLAPPALARLRTLIRQHAPPS